MSQAIETAKSIFLAFVNKDRAAAEKLIAPDFRFTSPLDNGIDRSTYFAVCWPNSKWMTDVEFVRIAENDGYVFVTYEAGTTSGKRFRNTEVLTIQNGKITAVEVYFGWNSPHDIAEAQHKDP